MNYFLAAATLTMLGYMLGVTIFRMRRDRVLAEREVTRGKSAFRPRERARFLLDRAFRPATEKPDWEDALVSRLSEVEPDRHDAARSPSPLPKRRPHTS
jgi:hypothetical protein